MFGPPRDGLGPLAAVVLVAAAVALQAALQAVVFTLRALEDRSRWASNAHDALNLVGLLALTGAFAAVGYPAPAAFLVAATTGIAVDQARHQSRSPRQSAWLSLAVGLLVAVPAAAFPARALALADRLAQALAA